MKKKEVRIINTGKHRAKATYAHQMDFINRWNRIVPPFINKQSKKTGNVIYGSRAINKIVGKEFARPTHDFDIYSGKPKSHALQLEGHIDSSVDADLAYVEEVHFQRGKQKGRMFRVVTRPHGKAQADYNPMPSNVSFVIIKGIRYETLDKAKPKYNRMIDEGESKRMLHAHQDLGRIELHERFKRRGL